MVYTLMTVRVQHSHALVYESFTTARYPDGNMKFKLQADGTGPVLFLRHTQLGPGHMDSLLAELNQ